MLILVSYDVPDDRRRTKLANALKDFGERVQYSVFEFLLDEAQINRTSSPCPVVHHADERFRPVATGGDQATS